MICKKCGCTDDKACPGGCYWVEPELCSKCANEGKTMKQLPGGFHLMPCASNVCQECAVDHPPEAPHNAQSLYYQYHFYAEHGRWPSWIDAMVHCSEEIKQETIEVLKRHGVDPDQ